MIGIGVIGIGKMGLNHIRILSELGNLKGVYDIDGKKGISIASKYHVKYYSKLSDLLDADVDGIIVATPTTTHYRISKQIIRKRKHLLIEKPIDSNYKQSVKLIKYAKQMGVILTVGHVERFNPGIKYLKNNIKEKKYGDIITISAKRVSNFPNRIIDIGVIFDLAIHDIDIINFLANSKIEEVFCVGGSYYNFKFEDYVNILMKFENGINGLIETNWLTPMKIRKLFLTCSKKYIELDYSKQTVQISSSRIREYNEENIFKTPYEISKQQIRLKKQEPLKLELLDFIKCIQTNSKPFVNGDSGAEAVRIAEAAVISLKRRKTIIMKDF